MKRLLFVLFVCLAVGGPAGAQTANVRLVGQVVCCAECWAKADRTKVEYGTAEDLLASKSCIANGDPTLIAVREDDQFTLYQLGPGKYRLPGKDWSEFVGRRVAVTGTVFKRKGGSAIRVDALEVLAPSIAEREAAQVVGNEVDLTLPDLFGAEQRLSALKGRIVILNFWATYCVPCRREMPDLAAIQNEYAAFGVQVVGASTDEAGDKGKVFQFVKEVKINFPIWTGATAADMTRFGLGGALPGTVIIGKDGRVAKVISGVVDQNVLKKQIDAMLANEQGKKPIAAAKPSRASSVPS